ncbi:tyrosine-type recombinase/integrase [Arthrobacter sp. MA-N2]|uniref:tyrosine-type recombinase/integrase n=1 Tax=Arthrobacter sp. MA-N2 TaxID=1101188 RepID=UPI0004B70FC4|nr:site-specific integrase [Arthrobacter sp. MA-N2]
MDSIEPLPAPKAALDVSRVVLPSVGEVVQTTDLSLAWRVVGLPEEVDVAVIDDFLRDLSANDCSPQTLRSYAFDVLRWWRFLTVLGRRWEAASRQDVRDLVLWMRQAAGLGAKQGYRPAFINHMLSVLSVFYEHQARRGEGPVINPVPAAGSGVRRYAHHNPLEEFQPQPRAPYRQRVVDSPPRALSDDLVDRIFTRLRTNRDRALVAMYLSTGARASGLLGMTGRDVDWGNQTIGVISKGTRAYQWVPASPDSLTWLRLYLSEAPRSSPGDALWWTLRRPYRPLRYSAVRAVLERVNETLGTDVTLHDFRHTCATRLASDPTIPLTDVQAVLRHAHLSTTSRYIHTQTEDMLARVHQHHQAPRPQPPETNTAWGYSDSDLADLFGETP